MNQRILVRILEPTKLPFELIPFSKNPKIKCLIDSMNPKLVVFPGSEQEIKELKKALNELDISYEILLCHFLD